MRTTRTTLSALTLLALAALLLASPAAAQLTINETTNATCPGCVGIGAASPTTTLDVEGDAGDTMLVVRETALPEAQRVLFSVLNTGNVSLSLDNIGTVDPSSWQLQNRWGDFRVTLAGTGVGELTLDQGGNLSLVGGITTAGPVGIGTTTPASSSMLHVKAATGGGPIDSILLENNGPSRLALRNTAITSSSTQDQNWILNSNGDLRFTAGTDDPELTLDAAGNGAFAGNLTANGSLGIGTTSPEFVVHAVRPDTNVAYVAEREDGATAFINATSIFGQFGTTTPHPIRFLVNNNATMRLNADNSLVMTSGATCSPGGVWISTSTRAAKDNIRDLSSDEAIETLAGLEPVRFNYKAEPDEESLGFIAEDVPDLVATNSRDSLSPMDLVAVLTKVVQEQQKTIAELSTRVSELEASTPR